MAVIPDEAVRGRTPPPWFTALSGLDRFHAFSDGRLPWPPIARLLGMRPTHIVPGAVTFAMPATEATLGGNGQLNISPLMATALEAACTTAVPANFFVSPLRYTMNPFRPAYAQPGNLLARARVINSSRLYVFAEVQIEDPQGRHLAHGTMQAVRMPVEPPPPAPPEPIPAVEEPVYETPDPYLRSYDPELHATLVGRVDGPELARRVQTEGLSFPSAEMFGLQIEQMAGGDVVFSMPASEWFSLMDRNVSCSAISSLCDMSGGLAGLTVSRVGTSMVILDGELRLFRCVPCDGRRIVAHSKCIESAANIFITDTVIKDSDEQIVALSRAGTQCIDSAKRSRRPTKESQRVLATLMFTDIVDSTAHAQRLGDAPWRALLEEHRFVVRREISRYNGREMDTAGDGFFLRFESPVRAIEAARALRTATAQLGLEVRTGIHTGECEVDGAKLAGMAVHIAARIQSTAKPNEILVSSTVKELGVGSGHEMDDRGEHRLKGVPDLWCLFAVND